MKNRVTASKKTILWTDSPRRENRTAAHPVLECLLAILFFLMLILTAAAFFLWSPLTALPNFQR